MLGASALPTPSTAGESCYYLPCTTTYHQYTVPNPTRRGMFISHFDENGVPQSIVTPSDSDTTCTEVVLNSNYT